MNPLLWAETALTDIEYSYIYAKVPIETTIERLEGFKISLEYYLKFHPMHQQQAEREIRGATFLIDMFKGLKEMHDAKSAN